MNKPIKTRFAPSPTGYLHIGGLRTALYNYLFAKQNGGVFLLRIEDTDKNRQVEKAEIELIKTLQKMGLNWQEGPILANDDKIAEKDPNGPYFQSKRLDIYQKYINDLINKGEAYYCNCSANRLAELKAESEAQKLPPKYDGCCRNKNLMPKNDEKFVVRLKVPESGSVKFIDLVRGEIEIAASEIDDQILIKSDGYPTYHLANVVDDHLMGISHVIRGEEWLPSTPKHILLYQAFGWEPPQFAHLPLLLNPDKSKLSKRQGDVAVEDFLDKGYLPEALINYVALLGWHPADDRELFKLTDLIKEFSLKRVQKAGAIFDITKLDWFNCEYIKQKSNKQILILAKKFLPKANKKTLLKLINLEKERINNLSEICSQTDYIFKIEDYQPEILIFKKSNKETTLRALNYVTDELNKIIFWNKKSVKSILLKTVKNLKLGNGDVFWPARVAVSGLQKSPPPEEIMEILGKKESLKRIKKAIHNLN